MANCAGCGREVGCPCNLHGGYCTSCMSNKSTDKSSPDNKVKTKQRIVYSKPEKPAPPVTGFTEILKDKGLSREDKIKRINDILEKARKQMEDDNKL